MITKDQHDHLTKRCPSLGGEVPFLYCRKQNEGKLCLRLPECWTGLIDVQVYLQTFFTPEEIGILFSASPPGRMKTFLLNLERVNKMQKENKQKEKIVKAIQTLALDGKISCSQALDVADQYQFQRKEMGKLLNELKIKIKNCQLGCF